METETSKQNVLISQLKLENKVLNQELESYGSLSLHKMNQLKSQTPETSPKLTYKDPSCLNTQEKDNNYYELETHKLHANVNHFLEQHDTYQENSNEKIRKNLKFESLNTIDPVNIYQLD